VTLFLSSIFEWLRLRDNQLAVAIEKCAVLHLGVTNPKREYEIGGSIIPQVESIRDIGIEVDQTMKFSTHCKTIAQRANRLSNLFFLTFRCRDKEFMLNFYATYIRPLLETATTVWNPYLMKDINVLEGVQRKFTKRVPGMFERSYEQRRAALGLKTLEHRRLCNDLTMCFRALNGFIDLDFHEFFEFNRGRHLRGHCQKLVVPKFRKNCRKYDFACRTVNAWNALPEELFATSTLFSFKRKLNALDLSHFLNYRE